MKVLYVRISSVDQRSDRQRVNEKEFDLIVEDKCSGSVPLFERQGGKKLLKLIEKDIEFTLHVYSIDRLGRNLKDLINTIHFFNEKGIGIHFISQCLKTIDENGKENPISKMIISILGVVSEMERNQIRERQREGIELGKLRGVYKGRQRGTTEDKFQFLSKHKKVVELLQKGYKGTEISSITGRHVNTISKVKKMLEEQDLLSEIIKEINEVFGNTPEGKKDSSKKLLQDIVSDDDFFNVVHSDNTDSNKFDKMSKIYEDKNISTLDTNTKLYEYFEKKEVKDKILRLLISRPELMDQIRTMG